MASCLRHDTFVITFQKKPMYKALTLFLISLCGCTSTQQPLTNIHKENSRLVYHIQPDDTLDEMHFTLCNVNTAYPYYGTELSPQRDKRELIKYFKEGYRAPTKSTESGFISIRFMVNCYGMPGRYRVLQFDKHYQPVTFDSSVTSQLLNLTKGVKDWVPKTFETVTYDSYCYFLFKIENGKLTDILP
jgi:hypothetical protein